jgi:cell division protein FtsB
MFGLSAGARLRGLNLILSLVLGALVFNAVWAPMGPTDLLLLRRHRANLTAQRDRLAADNGRLEGEIVRLKSDDSYLQSLIRQQLGYIRTGELVYRFPSSDQP